jgi:hypothetical protein
MSAPLTNQNSALSTSTLLNTEPRTLNPLSEKRLLANRANALKSTGPRTLEGKARSALNSLKHGLTASTPIKPGEDPAEFNLFQDGMLEELNPLTVEQFNRAQALIEVSWKLHRYRITEAIVLQKDADSRTAYALRDWERRCEQIRNENYAKRRVDKAPMPEKPSHQYTADELLALSFFAEGARSPLQLLDRYRSSLLRQLSKLTREYRELQKQPNEPTGDSTAGVSPASAADVPPTDDGPQTTDNEPLTSAPQNEATGLSTAGVSPASAASDVPSTDDAALITDNEPLTTAPQNEATPSPATDPNPLATDNRQLATPQQNEPTAPLPPLLNPEPRPLTPVVQIEPAELAATGSPDASQAP